MYNYNDHTNHYNAIFVDLMALKPKIPIYCRLEKLYE